MTDTIWDPHTLLPLLNVNATVAHVRRRGGGGGGGGREGIKEDEREKALEACRGAVPVYIAGPGEKGERGEGVTTKGKKKRLPKVQFFQSDGV